MKVNIMPKRDTGRRWGYVLWNALRQSDGGRLFAGHDSGALHDRAGSLQWLADLVQCSGRTQSSLSCQSKCDARKPDEDGCPRGQVGAPLCMTVAGHNNLRKLAAERSPRLRPEHVLAKCV